MAIKLRVYLIFSTNLATIYAKFLLLYLQQQS